MADDGAGRPTRADAPHDVHDLLLVAAWAGGDGSGEEHARAAALVEACSDCAALADDLRAIRRTAASLPPPERSRDYRLTPADAERLRPRGLRRLVAALGRPHLSGARPIAAALTTLGLAGLLVSAISFAGPQGGVGAGASDDPTIRMQLRTPDIAGQGTDMELGPFSTPDEEGQASAAPGAPTSPEPTPDEDETAPAGTSPAVPPVAVAAGSTVLVVAGVALFVAASRQRRRSG